MAETRPGGVYQTSGGQWVDANGKPTNKPTADETKQRHDAQQQADEGNLVQRQIAALQAQLASLLHQTPQPPPPQPDTAQQEQEREPADEPQAPSVPRRERR